MVPREGGKKKDAGWHLTQSALCHKEQHMYCSKAHFSQGRKHLGACPAATPTDFFFRSVSYHLLPTNCRNIKIPHLVTNTKYCSTKHCAKNLGSLVTISLVWWIWLVESDCRPKMHTTPPPHPLQQLRATTTSLSHVSADTHFVLLYFSLMDCCMCSAALR